MQSIRKQLLIGAIGAMVALLVASGTFLFIMVRKSLLDQFDDALVEQAEVLSSGVEIKSGLVVFDNEDFDMDEFQRDDGGAYLQIFTDGDVVVYRSPSLKETSLTYGPDENEGPVIGWIDLPGGRNGRAAYLYFAPAIDEEDNSESEIAMATARRDRIELILARDIAPVMATLGRLELILLAFGAGTIAIAAALLHAVINRAITPLDALASAIGTVKPDDLSTVIAIRGCPAELRPVVDRLNEMLACLKQAFDRERGFSADVAHELRTPLAGIRSTLEVALSRERTAPEYESTLRDCLDVADDMQAMVENLLTLARLDSGEFEVVPEETTLDTLLESTFAPMRSDFAARSINVHWHVEKDLQLESDTALLRIVARNVFDNALSYTNDGGWVDIAARSNGARAVLRVRNSGCGISREQAKNVFGRFWQGDTSRSMTGAHYGLGLSLVQKIAITLGGTAEVELGEDGVFGINITVPKTMLRA